MRDDDWEDDSLAPHDIGFIQQLTAQRAPRRVKKRPIGFVHFPPAAAPKNKAVGFVEFPKPKPKRASRPARPKKKTRRK